MNLEELRNKLNEVESQMETLSLQKAAINDAINIAIANNNIGDRLYNVYKVPNGDGSVFRIHTRVKDICQTSMGQGIVYEVLEIHLDISDTIHAQIGEAIYVNADEFCSYNEFVSKEELVGIKKVYDVIKGIVLMNGVYTLV